MGKWVMETHHHKPQGQVSKGFWWQPAALEKEEQETQAGFYSKDYAFTVRKSKKDMDLQHYGRKL